MKVTTPKRLHKPGTQHYHILIGMEGMDIPLYNISYDIYDEAMNNFLETIDTHLPGYLEPFEEEEIREAMVDRVIDSTPGESAAAVTVTTGGFRVKLTDCYGCMHPHYN